MTWRHLFFWCTASVGFGVDRVTKIWAERTLPLDTPVPGLPGYEWYLHYNEGAAGGLDVPLGLLIGIGISAVLLLTWFAWAGRHDRNVWLLSGLGLMLGGTLGNLFDRVLLHAVIDFIHPIHDTVIYNVADKCIWWGLYLAVFGLWWSAVSATEQKQTSPLSSL